MDPTSQQIDELRSRFFQKLESDGFCDPDGLHPLDLSRIKYSDDWLRRFLVHQECNVDNALQMLWGCVEWRKKFGTNDINESNIKMEYVTDGSLFYHNRDKDGKYLLIFKSKKHVKGQKDMDELRRVVVYWFERLERADKGNQISIFFDMADTGMSNMDMELIKYLIGLFKVYYPDFLNTIIVFEMPWILNAAFKVIKTWLPAKAVQKIKFVNKASLKDYVDPDQALTCWGGNDDYTFTFVPEQQNSTFNDKLSEDIRKKVHFADGSPIVETSPMSFSEINSPKTDGHQPSNSSVLISPSDIMTFTSEGSEMTGMVTLTNISDKIISYKIKTTAPEKFRVRPSTGILAVNSSISINVSLQSGYHATGLTRDKFLIMTLPVNSSDMTQSELAEFWKVANTNLVEQHRLKCSIGSSVDGPVRNGSAFGSLGIADVDQQVSQILSQMSQLNTNHCDLHTDVRRLQKLQWITMLMILVLGIIVIYFLRQDQEGSSSHMTCSRPL